MKAKVAELKVEDFAIRESTSLPRTKTRKPRRKTGEFLQGPIPWSWIRSAARIKGCALFVALAIRHFRDLRKQQTVRVSLADLGGEVVSRHAVWRALQRLETQQLIEVRREPGKLLHITVLEVFTNPQFVQRIRY